jgi:PAS domain S-box-containing protein
VSKSDFLEPSDETTIFPISYEQQMQLESDLEIEFEQHLEELMVYKHAVDESSIIAITDIKGIITYANKKFCEISKYSEEELIGKNHRILKSDEHLPEFYEDMWRTISVGNNWKGTVKNKAKDGSFYWVKTVIIPLMGKTQKTERYMSIRTDVTKQKENELLLSETLEKNKKIDQLKQEFVTMISHELKTPLTPIMLWAGALKNENIMGTLTPDQLNAINTISDSADELSRLISDIFDSYKLDLKNLTFSSQEINISELVNRVYNSSTKTSVKKGIILENTTHEIGSMYGDSKRIMQILYNLINNAMDFVDPNNGKIEINASIDDNFVLFYVKDNGIGISSKDQTKLFQKFYQVDTSITRKHGGSGLGLSICHGMITGMNGKIWVESKVGEGSTFYFTLPTVMLNDDSKVSKISSNTKTINLKK